MTYSYRLQNRRLNILHQFTENVIQVTIFFSYTLILYLFQGFFINSPILQEREKNFNASDVENLDNEEDNDEVFMKKKKRLAMLDLLLLAKKNNLIDAQGVREEVDTFMFEVRLNEYIFMPYLYITYEIKDQII